MQVGSFYGRGSTIRANAMRGGFGGPFGGSTQNYGGGYINPYRYSGMNPKDSPGDKLFADIMWAQTRLRDSLAPFEALAAMITRTGTTNLAGDLERTRGAITGAAQNVQAWQTGRLAFRIAGTQMDPTSTTSTPLAVLMKQDNVILIVPITATGGLSGITQGVRNVG